MRRAAYRLSPSITDCQNFIPKTEKRSYVLFQVTLHKTQVEKYIDEVSFPLHFYFLCSFPRSLRYKHCTQPACFDEQQTVDITEAYLCQVILLLLKTCFYISFHCCIFLAFYRHRGRNKQMKPMEKMFNRRPASTKNECLYSLCLRLGFWNVERSFKLTQ